MSIETEQLILRPITPQQARLIAAGTPGEGESWADGFPREDDLDGIGMLLRETGDATQAPPFGSLLIIDRASGQTIGTIGFFGPPDAEGQVMIGYGLVEQYRGNGLGTEALLALVGYCRTRPEVTAILADTDLDNKASQRVLDKGGFTFTHADEELCYYRLTL
jgi:RimJ/RimL family protein N-acetyltransferase